MCWAHSINTLVAAGLGGVNTITVPPRAYVNIALRVCKLFLGGFHIPQSRTIQMTNFIITGTVAIHFLSRHSPLHRENLYPSLLLAYLPNQPTLSKGLCSDDGRINCLVDLLHCRASLIHSPISTQTLTHHTVRAPRLRPNRLFLQRCCPRKAPLRLQRLVPLLLRPLDPLRHHHPLLPTPRDPHPPRGHKAQALHHRHLLARRFCLHLCHRPLRLLLQQLLQARQQLRPQHLQLHHRRFYLGRDRAELLRCCCLLANLWTVFQG